MSPEFGKQWFRVAIFMILISAGLLFFVKPGSAEFVITIVTLGVGILFVILIVLMVKLSK